MSGWFDRKVFPLILDFTLWGKRMMTGEPAESHDGQTNKRVTKPEKNPRPQRGTPWTGKKHFTIVLSGFPFLTFEILKKLIVKIKHVKISKVWGRESLITRQYSSLTLTYFTNVEVIANVRTMKSTWG